MNFSYFRTNKQRSMSRPTQSRSHSTLRKIKGTSKDLIFKEKETRGGKPPAPVRRQGLCGSGPLAGVLGPGLGGQGFLESRGAGRLPEAPAPLGSEQRLSAQRCLLQLTTPASEPVPVRAFWGGVCLGRCVPASCQAARQPPSLRAQGWRQSAGLRRPSHGPSRLCHVPQRCAPSACSPRQPLESAHLSAWPSRPPAQ